MSKNQCPICGELQQEYAIKDMVYTYKNVEFTIAQPALWCSACGEGIISAKDSNSVAKEIQTEKAKIDDILTPDEIKKTRTKLKLTQKAAAELFGGGINAFNRYEHGKLSIPRSMSELLRILNKHPDQLKEILDRKKRKKSSSRRVKLRKASRNKKNNEKKYA